MAPKFPLFTKGSKLPLNKGFKNMFELLQSCGQPSLCFLFRLEFFKWQFAYVYPAKTTSAYGIVPDKITDIFLISAQK